MFLKKKNMDRVMECTAVLETVICDINMDRILSEPHTQVFKTMHTNKASGPDNTWTLLLKLLLWNFHLLGTSYFRTPLILYKFNSVEKKSVIKLQYPRTCSPSKTMTTDRQQVTSNVYKAFDRLVLEKLHADVGPLLLCTQITV